MASLYRQLRKIENDREGFLKVCNGDESSVAYTNFRDVCYMKEASAIADYSAKNMTFNRMIYGEGFTEKLTEDFGDVTLWRYGKEKRKTSSDLKDVLGVRPFPPPYRSGVGLVLGTAGGLLAGLDTGMSVGAGGFGAEFASIAATVGIGSVRNRMASKRMKFISGILDRAYSSR
jgi:hypothetical protein